MRVAGILDYLLWRGDLPLHCSPFSPQDGLILAMMSYNDLGPNAADRPGMALSLLTPLLPELDASASANARRCRALLLSMADTLRYGTIRLLDHVNLVDDQRDIQFSAVTARLSNENSCICFRGTDGTLVGWREDFAMAYESPVPAQMEALTYLERAALRTEHPLILTGHSKGGNLAVYAAAHADPATQDRIRAVYTFDGPGVDDVTFRSDGYLRIRSRIRAYIPQSSVVGLLLAQHPDYTVVHADAATLLQHDPFTWRLIGPHFEELGQVDAASLLLDETIHQWLLQAAPEQRRLFADTVFDVIEATGAKTLSDLSADKLRSALAIIAAARTIDPDTLGMIISLIGQFLTIGMGNLWDAVIRQPRQLMEHIINHTGGQEHG